MATFDRTAAQQRAARAEEQRKEIQTRFPPDQWPSLPLERYALGVDDSENTYCRWLEFKSADLGSMRGGSATKLVVYKKKNEPGWFFHKPATDEQDASRLFRGDVISCSPLLSISSSSSMTAISPPHQKWVITKSLAPAPR
jgi:5-methylcytosine-specific restriction protein B